MHIVPTRMRMSLSFKLETLFLSALVLTVGLSPLGPLFLLIRSLGFMVASLPCPIKMESFCTPRLTCESIPGNVGLVVRLHAEMKGFGCQPTAAPFPIAPIRIVKLMPHNSIAYVRGKVKSAKRKEYMKAGNAQSTLVELLLVDDDGDDISVTLWNTSSISYDELTDPQMLGAVLLLKAVFVQRNNYGISLVMRRTAPQSANPGYAVPAQTCELVVESRPGKAKDSATALTSTSASLASALASASTTRTSASHILEATSTA
jgi:hypothetical protein